MSAQEIDEQMRREAEVPDHEGYWPWRKGSHEPWKVVCVKGWRADKREITLRVACVFVPGIEGQPTVQEAGGEWGEEIIPQPGTPPSHPGKWWWREAPDDDWDVVSVTKSTRRESNDLVVWFFGDEMEENVEFIGGQWGEEVIHGR